jgi:hypothetical protein
MHADVFAPPTSAQRGLILQNEPNLAAKKRNSNDYCVAFRSGHALERVMTTV